MMEKMIHRDDVLKDLWTILEKTPKILKDLSGNIASKDIRDAMFSELNRSIDLIPMVEKTELGVFYEYKNYQDERVVGKLIGYVSDEGKYYRLKLRILYATKNEVRYNKITDDYYIDIKEIHNWTAVEIKQEDLPLYVGYEFTGTLLSEMIKNNE